MTYGALIRERRKSLKLTQERLAEAVGVSKTSVVMWELEKYPPTDALNVARLEDSLKMGRGELLDLLAGGGNPTRPPRAAGEETLTATA